MSTQRTAREINDEAFELRIKMTKELIASLQENPDEYYWFKLGIEGHADYRKYAALVKEASAKAMETGYEND